VRASILALPGDGIGPEVTSAAIGVLTAVASRFGHSFDIQQAPIGGAALRLGLTPLPAETLAAARHADAILLGAVGDRGFDTAVADRRPEVGLLAIRSELGLYANLRPARVWPGLEGYGPIKPEILAGTDLLVVRELTGGLYYGQPRGFSADGASAFNTLRYSRAEIERISRVAFDAARRRKGRITSVDKANVLEVSRLWRETVDAVGRDFPDVSVDHMYVDACAMKLALEPSSFDVILTENLFGDVLSDEAGAIVGSLGLLPSASIGEGPGVFEPVHGSAPDLAGRNLANPIGAIASAAMLLEYALSLREEAAAVITAIEQVLTSGLRTIDISVPTKAATTSQVGAAIREQVLTGSGKTAATPR
jgi:3-isopropylmalate dehydrogenase